MSLASGGAGREEAGHVARCVTKEDEETLSRGEPSRILARKLPEQPQLRTGSRRWDRLGQASPSKISLPGGNPGCSVAELIRR